VRAIISYCRRTRRFVSCFGSSLCGNLSTARRGRVHVYRPGCRIDHDAIVIRRRFHTYEAVDHVVEYAIQQFGYTITDQHGATDTAIVTVIVIGVNDAPVANDDKARERILSNPCAIIASPVTMQGGASAFYRRRLEGSAKNAVILPSNAASSYGTHRAAGEEEQWRVERVSFAAHCTQDELLGITERLSPRQIILIHGSKRRISDLAFRLAPNHKIHAPAVGETVRTVL
jgi:hypothetical protein